MGCDIHPVVEFKLAGKWHKHDGPWLCYACDGEGALREKRGGHPCHMCNGSGRSQTPWRERNYDVFGMLAGVRTDAWQVMSDGRGLPRAMSRSVDEDELGDHSHGFVTLAELQAYNWWQTKPKFGVVGLSVFARWDRTTPPIWYSHGVSGPSVKHLTTEQADAYLVLNAPPPQCLDFFEPSNTYVHDCAWLETAAQCAGNFLTFVAEMTSAAKRLNVSAADIRLVFGFDS